MTAISADGGRRAGRVTLLEAVWQDISGHPRSTSSLRSGRSDFAEQRLTALLRPPGRPATGRSRADRETPPAVSRRRICVTKQLLNPLIHQSTNPPIHQSFSLFRGMPAVAFRHLSRTPPYPSPTRSKMRSTLRTWYVGSKASSISPAERTSVISPAVSTMSWNGRFSSQACIARGCTRS